MRGCISPIVAIAVIGLQQVAIAQVPGGRIVAGKVQNAGRAVQDGVKAIGNRLDAMTTGWRSPQDGVKAIGSRLDAMTSGWRNPDNPPARLRAAGSRAIGSGSRAIGDGSRAIGSRLDAITSGWRNADNPPARLRAAGSRAIGSGSRAIGDGLDVFAVGLRSGWSNAWAASGQCVQGVKSCCLPEPRETCPPCWEHRSFLFGDFLYLQPGGVDMAYATHVDGMTAAAVPLASPNMVDPNYEPGFRIGGGLYLDSSSTLKATYWFYESGTSNQVSLPGGTGFLRPELTHPNTLTVASDRLSAKASHGIDFQMADLDYVSTLCCGDCWLLNYVLGVRYANLDQDFRASYTNLDTITVDSEIDFDGVGPRIGFDGERELGDKGLMLFSRATANFIVGEFNANYRQRNVTTTVTQAVTGFTDDRIVTQLELELGIGWHNCCDTFRLYGGYYVAAWLNSVTTPSFIEGVQRSDFNGVDDTLTFDGLTLRAELRY